MGPVRRGRQFPDDIARQGFPTDGSWRAATPATALATAAALAASLATALAATLG